MGVIFPNFLMNGFVIFLLKTLIEPPALFPQPIPIKQILIIAAMNDLNTTCVVNCFFLLNVEVFLKTVF